MKTGEVLIAAGIGVAVLLLATGASASGGGGRPVIGPKTGPGGKGKIWTTPGKGGGGGGNYVPGTRPAGVPADFDFGGNGLWISPDCDFVVEGNLFWNDSKAEEAPTLAGTLALARDNSAIGFVDYLTETEGLRTPQDIAWRMLQEASPLCADLDPNDPSQWGDGLAAWFNNLVDRITTHLESFIDFGEG